MPSFKQRSYKKELLDRDDIPFRDIERNMQELEFINRKLGGHLITLDGIKELAMQQRQSNEPLTIMEIGCGGGDNLRAIKEWTEKIKRPAILSGIDINQECIAYANLKTANEGIQFIHSDYRLVNPNPKPDVIFSSLFCHHFTDQELIDQLKWMQQNSRLGFFINDLHRHPLAFYSIKILSGLFSKSYLVKNDAPLSVQRSFRKPDWQNLFASANIKKYTCQWRWAFRWLVICSHDKNAC